jgi:mono/diheme cytochrome c family protein
MRFLSYVGALAILIAIAGAVYFFGGFYNVAATAPETELVAAALRRIRIASVEHHGVEKPAISMDDQGMIERGARAYAVRGCTNCHGGPAVMRAKFSEGLRPAPTNLKDVANELDPSQIFWAVRNGIRMTGMPGFSLIEVSDQELWTIAAFVKRLPSVSEDD